MNNVTKILHHDKTQIFKNNLILKQILSKYFSLKSLLQTNIDSIDVKFGNQRFDDRFKSDSQRFVIGICDCSSLVFVAFLWTGQPTVHLNMRRTRYTSCTCPRERCAGEKQDEPDVKMAYVRRWIHSTEKNLSRAARD